MWVHFVKKPAKSYHKVVFQHTENVLQVNVLEPGQPLPDSH